MASHGKQTPDDRLIERAIAVLEEMRGYLDYRVGTYDEAPGEAEAAQHGNEISVALQARLAADV